MKHGSLRNTLIPFLLTGVLACAQPAVFCAFADDTPQSTESAAGEAGAEQAPLSGVSAAETDAQQNDTVEQQKVSAQQDTATHKDASAQPDGSSKQNAPVKEKISDAADPSGVQKNAAGSNEGTDSAKNDNVVSGALLAGVSDQKTSGLPDMKTADTDDTKESGTDASKAVSSDSTFQDSSENYGFYAQAKRSAPPRREDGSSNEVATVLTLSGPASENTSYVGDFVTFTAVLKDSSGKGIEQKTIYLGIYQPGISGSGKTRTALTDKTGTAEFILTDLDAGIYFVYAEFRGDASEWGGSIYSASGETSSISLNVKPASEKPAEEHPSEHPGKKTKTSISIVKAERELPTSQKFEITVKVTDPNGNPVDDKQGKQNIELYVDNESLSTATLNNSESLGTPGEGTLTSGQLDEGTEHDICVKYIGSDEYEGSESHYHLIVSRGSDSYTPNNPQGEDTPAEEDPQKEDDKDPEPDQGGSQTDQIPTPTSSSLTITRDGDQSRWFYFKAEVKDKDGKPVSETVTGYNNIELYINGQKIKDDKLTAEGDRSFLYSLKQNDIYDVFVKYIGRGKYASSESTHITLTVSDNSYTSKPVEQNPGPESGGAEEGQTPGDDNQNPGEENPNPDEGHQNPDEGSPDPEGGSLKPGDDGNPGRSAQAGAGHTGPGSSDSGPAPQTAQTSEFLSADVQISGEVSANGTAKTTSQVNVKTDEASSPDASDERSASVSEPSGTDMEKHTADEADAPKTGDTASLNLWLILLLTSTAAMAASAIHSIYRKKSV